MSSAGMLGQFLTDIGAASLAPAVKLTTADEASGDAPPPFAGLFTRLDEEIASINDQTRVLLEDNWSEFQEQVADGKELLARMDEEQSELRDIESELDGERLPTLVDKLGAHSQLAQSYSLSTHTLTILTSLLSLHNAVSTVSSHTTAGSLPLAVAALRDLQGALQRGAAPWIEQTDAWNALRRWGSDEQTRLEAAILGAFEACFEFVGTPEVIGTKLTLRQSVAAAPRGELLDVPVLLQALEDVFVLGGGGKKVDAQVARVAKHMLKYMITPFLEVNGRPDSVQRFEFVYEDQPGAKIATLQARATSTDGPQDPLASVSEFLAFFAKNTTLLPPSPYAASFTANLTPIIQQQVISLHLAPSLPAAIGQLASFLPTVTSASAFEATFLPSSGYFAFLPHGRVREEARVVQSWVDRVDKHWAKKVGDAALERVREQIRTQDWQGERVDTDVEVDTDVPGQKHTVKEPVLVSNKSKTIVKVADDLLSESLDVASISFEHPTFTPAAPHLLHSFASLMSLYRAIAPVHHASALSSSASAAIQFANDTDYLAREVEVVWNRAADKASGFDNGKARLEVEQAIRATAKMGRDWREKHIRNQREALMASIDEADGFTFTGDDARFAKCERAVEQIVDMLERLARSWKPVMNQTAFYSTLGTLVNDVLQRILDEIMEQMDISEQESIRLNKLCKMLHGLEELFEGDVTSVGAEVQVWFKFVFLSELLEASMADIMFLFNEGHLVDFEPAAIAKLVRALFSDSSLRDRNLQRIMQGHPEIVSDDAEGMEDATPRTPPPMTSRRAPSTPGLSPKPRVPSPTSATTVPSTMRPRSSTPDQAAEKLEKPGRMKLGAKKVGTKVSSVLPPASPPVAAQSSPPPPSPPRKATSPIVSQRSGTPPRADRSEPVSALPAASPASPPGERDPGLDDGFDDDGWGFSPEGSPKASPPAAPVTEPAAVHRPRMVESEPVAPNALAEEEMRAPIQGVSPVQTATVATAGAAVALAGSLALVSGDGEDDDGVADEVEEPAEDAWGLDLGDAEAEPELEQAKEIEPVEQVEAQPEPAAQPEPVPEPEEPASPETESAIEPPDQVPIKEAEEPATRTPEEARPPTLETIPSAAAGDDAPSDQDEGWDFDGAEDEVDANAVAADHAAEAASTSQPSLARSTSPPSPPSPVEEHAIEDQHVGGHGSDDVDDEPFEFEHVEMPGSGGSDESFVEAMRVPSAMDAGLLTASGVSVELQSEQVRPESVEASSELAPADSEPAGDEVDGSSSILDVDAQSDDAEASVHIEAPAESAEVATIVEEPASPELAAESTVEAAADEPILEHDDVEAVSEPALDDESAAPLPSSRDAESQAPSKAFGDDPIHPVEQHVSELFGNSEPSAFDQLDKFQPGAAESDKTIQASDGIATDMTDSSTTDDVNLPDFPDRDELATPVLERMEEAPSRDEIPTPSLDAMESQPGHHGFSPREVDLALSAQTDETVEAERYGVDEEAVDQLANADIVFDERGQSSNQTFDIQPGEAEARDEDAGFGQDEYDEEAGWGIEEAAWTDEHEREAGGLATVRRRASETPDAEDFASSARQDSAVVAGSPVERPQSPAPEQDPLTYDENHSEEGPADIDRDLTPVPPPLNDEPDEPATEEAATVDTVKAEEDLTEAAHDGVKKDHSPAVTHAFDTDAAEPEALDEESGWGLDDVDDLEAGASKDDLGASSEETPDPPTEQDRDVSAPMSPELTPVKDHDDSVAPTPLQQQTPPREHVSLRPHTVATPWDELQKQDAPVQSSNGLEPSPFTKEAPMSQPSSTDNSVVPQEDVDAGEDDGWGLEEELEGLEQAPEDFVVPERVASPTRLPPPAPPLDFSPRPFIAQSMPLRMSPPRAGRNLGKERVTSPAKSSPRRSSAAPVSPPRKAPTYTPSPFFSPPRSAPTAARSTKPAATPSAPAPEDSSPAEEGWGFEEDEGLGTMDDGFTSNGIDQELSLGMDESVASKGNGTGVAADEEAWGF